MECKPLQYSLEGLGEGLNRVMAYSAGEDVLQIDDSVYNFC